MEHGAGLPQVSSIAFAAPPPDLQPWPLMETGLRDSSPARPAKDASYPVSVRQVAALLHTSFRRHLAMTPLCFASPSPPSGWTGDFHPQAIEHAGHTTMALRARCSGVIFIIRQRPPRSQRRLLLPSIAPRRRPRL